MTTLGKAASIHVGLGFDTASYVDLDKAKAMRAAGYAFVARYLRRDQHVNQNPDLSGGAVSLSVLELRQLLAADLQVSLVQFGDGKLVPSAEQGTTVGAAAAANARALGAPSSVTLWCDVEWSSGAAPTEPQPVLDYINAWAAQVVAGGYRAGLYVGPNVPVDGKSLYYDLPKITGYWKAASKTSWVAERGFQIIQGLSFTTAEGLNIDPDMAAYDGRGDRCTVIAPA
ncbi:MAG: DUF1906 domain-containing protein [Myxococcales bacterium]|nr:DUF1906 domain-containing protein [Myxococcales bacterium]